jgi:hypothetical protein
VPSTGSQRSEERLRAFQERAEYATANGYNLPAEISEQRNNYYRDYQFLLDTLARLGTELKGYPGRSDVTSALPFIITSKCKRAFLLTFFAILPPSFRL